jgi:hypothetical protein
MNFYKQNPHELTQYLIQVAIKTTLVSAIIAVFAGFLFVGGNILRFTNASDLVAPQVLQNLQNIFNSLGLFISLLGSLMIINICIPALSTWTKVHNFDEYKNAVSSKLNEKIIHSGNGNLGNS